MTLNKKEKNSVCMIDIDERTAQNIIKSFQIPVKPQILIEIQNVHAKKDPSLDEFAEVISKDVALSSAVLKIINSPVFGLNRTIINIKQSVVMLGIKNVSNLASFFLLKNAFAKQGGGAISHEKYWDTAMQTANMMTILVDLLDFKIRCPIENAYAFGLFRDCGIPLMAMKYPDYRDVLIEANSSPESVFTSIENTHYQTNHAIVGYFIASSWNLPKNLCELILRHHEADFLGASDISQKKKDLYALVLISSNVLSQFLSGKDDSEWYLGRESVLGYLGLSDIDYEEIEIDAKEEFAIKFG